VALRLKAIHERLFPDPEARPRAVRASGAALLASPLLQVRPPALTRTPVTTTVTDAAAPRDRRSCAAITLAVAVAVAVAVTVAATRVCRARQRLLADAFDAPLLVAGGAEEASARGAAALALLACGGLRGFSGGEAERTVAPTPGGAAAMERSRVRSVGLFSLRAVCTVL